MIYRPRPGQCVELHYRASLREYTGLHLARGVIVTAGGGRGGPLNALVRINDDRLVVVPRGQLFEARA